MAENNTNAEKDITTKEKILNSLEGNLEVTKVERIDWSDGVAVYCEFMKKGHKGSIDFNFMGGEYGIENFVFEGDDDVRDDVWDEITEWIEDNIEFTMSLKYKGKDVKFK